MPGCGKPGNGGGGLKARVVFPSGPFPGEPTLAADLGGWRSVYTFSVAGLKKKKEHRSMNS